ncbi:hypothetical protein SAMD00019534_074940, partial [Acytostelium subglobosum LB1]|uniref:hypothetical protein n=1 Tax=Acytostelium subglobosum LB1 TaxID=1410327 RepID=UPI000644F14C
MDYQQYSIQSLIRNAYTLGNQAIKYLTPSFDTCSPTSPSTPIMSTTTSTTSYQIQQQQTTRRLYTYDKEMMINGQQQQQQVLDGNVGGSWRSSVDHCPAIDGQHQQQQMSMCANDSQQYMSAAGSSSYQPYPSPPSSAFVTPSYDDPTDTDHLASQPLDTQDFAAIPLFNVDVDNIQEDSFSMSAGSLDDIDMYFHQDNQFIVIPSDIDFYVHRVMSWLSTYDNAHFVQSDQHDTMEQIKIALSTAKNILESYETPMTFFPLVVYYADKFVKRCGINHNQFFNLLFISAVICVKFWGESIRVDYSYLAKCFSCSKKDLCLVERLFLRGINYELYTLMPTVKEFLDDIEKERMALSR